MCRLWGKGSNHSKQWYLVFSKQNSCLKFTILYCKKYTGLEDLQSVVIIEWSIEISDIENKIMRCVDWVIRRGGRHAQYHIPFKQIHQQKHFHASATTALTGVMTPIGVSKRILNFVKELPENKHFNSMKALTSISCMRLKKVQVKRHRQWWIFEYWYD